MVLLSGCRLRAANGNCKEDVMTKADEAKAWALAHVGCPYIYGATGGICTPSYREARAAQYPEYAATMRKNCPLLSGSTHSCTNC